MNKERLRLLIDRFMDGTSTLEEERELETFFRNSDEVSDELKPYKMMFGYFDEGMKDMSLLDRHGCDSEDADADDAQHYGSHAKRRKGFALTVTMRRWTAVAACGALLFAAGFYIANNGDGATELAKEGLKEAPAQILNNDVPPIIKADTTESTRQKNDEPTEQKRLKKWRYKPAPPEVYIAGRQSTDIIDSVNNAARQLADNEVKKVEQEQQMMNNLIRAVNLLNSTEIAAADDEWETY